MVTCLQTYSSSLPPSPPTHAALPFGLLGSEGIVLFLNGFLLSGNASAEISANHYCTILSDDFIQCAVYSTAPRPPGGIEYIISPSLFAALPMEERQLWHSYVFEVKSGGLIEPHIPKPLDNATMEVPGWHVRQDGACVEV
jgi:hypothetical protein